MGDRVIVSVQNPIELDDYSEPQPDIALLRPRADFYELGHPQPNDVLLLIEVSDSMVRFDRTVNIFLYAQSGVAEVWVVDLTANYIEVYRQPVESGYEQVESFDRAQTVSVQAFADVAIAVSDLVG